MNLSIEFPPYRLVPSGHLACVVAALRGYVTQRRHNTAAVDPATVALGYALENIFVFSNTL